MPTIDIAEFVTVEAIPVAETGIDYPASTGPISLTTQMFDSAVEFTQDPHGFVPRIKISHGANPINGELQSLFEAYNQERDASLPSLGTLLNLRTENSGHTLVADWYGLPEWLAAIVETAYPARSIEGDSWYNEANMKSYDFIIQACALLGVISPGCTSLADLQELFSKSGPKIQVIEMARPKTNTKMGGSTQMPASLQVNVEDLRRSFYDEFAQGERYWWWDRELLADPWEFIVEDWDTGQLYRVPFTPSEDDNGDTKVDAWGEPTPVKINYVPDAGAIQKAQDAGVQAAMRPVGLRLEKAGTMLAINMSSPRAGERKQKEAKAAMAIDIPTLRTTLNVGEDVLPDEATEEQINAAIAAGVQPDPTPKADEEEPVTPPEGGTTATTEGTPTVAASGNTVTVDRRVWEETREGAQLAIKQAREGRKKDDEEFLEAAVRKGKISPASRNAYLAKLAGPSGHHDAPDREQIRTFIDGLEEGVIVPTNELGSTADENAKRPRGTGLFPELAAKEA